MLGRRLFLTALTAHVFAQPEDAITEGQASTEPHGPILSMDELVVSCDKFKTEFPDNEFSKQSDVSKIYMKVDETGEGPFKAGGLTKFATAFGIRVVANKEVPSEKILHVVNVLAKVLDPKETGKNTYADVTEAIAEFKPTLFVMKDSEAIHELMDVNNDGPGFPPEMKMCPYAFDFEVQSRINKGGDTADATCEPENTQKKVDRTRAFVVDHLIGRGFEKVLGPEKISRLKKIHNDAIQFKQFSPEHTGCYGEGLSGEMCSQVLLVSWSRSALDGSDVCWCKKMGALEEKLCEPEGLKSKLPEMAELLKGVLETDTIDIQSPYKNQGALIT